MTSRPLLWAGLVLASVVALAMVGSLLDDAGAGDVKQGSTTGSARTTSLEEFAASVSEQVDNPDLRALEITPALEGDSAFADATSSAQGKHGPASLTVHVVIVCNAPMHVFISLEPIDRPGTSQRWYEGSPLTWTDLPPGEYRVIVVPDVGTELVTQWVRLKPGEHGEVTIVAPNASAVAGTVINEEDDPVQEFLWRVETSSDTDDPEEGKEHFARSDGGHFCVPRDELPYEGLWRIAVHTRAGSTATSPWFDMAETSEVHDMMLVLVRPARITGIVSAEGRVLAKATVIVVASSEGDTSRPSLLPDRLAFGQTDSLGHFDVSVEHGRLVRLRVDHSDYLPWESEPLQLPAGGGAIHVNPQLSIGGRLIGKVLWEGMPNKDGWAMVFVRARRSPWNLPGDYGIGTVDRLGNFTVDGLMGEPHDVRLWTTPTLPGFPSESYPVEIVVGQTTELTIEITFDLEALLARPMVVIELRRPPELADEHLWIHVTDEEGQPIGEYEGLTEADTLTVHDLPVGPINVFAGTLFPETGLNAFTSASGQIPEVGSATPVVLDLAASLIEIQLGAAETVDFVVELADASRSTALWKQAMEFSSDEFGNCRIFGLAPGAYVVSCSARPGVERSVTVGSRPATVRFH